MKYPLLSKYIRQYEKKLRDILINAKENPDDFYFPRRGSFIRQFEGSNKDKLTDLEPLYDNTKKIFFKYISNINAFGYSKASYYGTSDTYFLWPKYPDDKIDYVFTLAYLNSRLVYFIYKAKNIFIKRSKTKVEHGLPIPNLIYFKNKEKRAIVELIKILTFYLINDSKDFYNNSLESIIGKIISSSYYISSNNKELKEDIISALEHHDNYNTKMIVDQLFYQLLDLNGKKINNLLIKYYNL